MYTDFQIDEERLCDMFVLSSDIHNKNNLVNQVLNLSAT